MVHTIRGEQSIHSIDRLAVHGDISVEGAVAGTVSTDIFPRRSTDEGQIVGRQPHDVGLELLMEAFHPHAKGAICQVQRVREVARGG